MSYRVKPTPRPTAPQPGPSTVEDPGPLVRPYARTGGRTRPTHALRLETLLSVPLGRPVDLADLDEDQRMICEACRMPTSTAELAVRLGLPLGAARVLIADVVELGLLNVHDSGMADDQRPSLDLLTRVHDGLRNL